MNSVAVVVLVVLLAEYALSTAAALLNLGALRSDVPDELSGIYDHDRYGRAQAYTRARTRFGLVRASVSLAILLLVWLGGGFGWLDEGLRSLGMGPVATGLAFIGSLALGSTVLSLPFRLYSTFVIEERFGFNRTSLATFGADLAKGLALSALLGGAILAIVLFFFEWAGSLAWLWCWVASVLFLLAIQFVMPTWIMPLFNKFTPLERGELREAIMAYASSAAFPLEGIFVIDGSRRSSKANAFFTGFGKRKRIALFDTLIAQHTTEELVAVVAHEIGHYKRRHIPRQLAIAVLHTGVLFWLLSLALGWPALFEAFYVRQPSVYAGLVFFGLLLTPIEVALSILVHALSRRYEFEADAFAALTTGRSEPLIAALKKLSAENLSNLTPHPLEVALHHSHPPLLQRIAALRAIEAAP